MKVYVVTHVDMGWDCVIGVFTDKEVARKEYSDEECYVIHEETLDRTAIEDYEDEIEEYEPKEVIDKAYTGKTGFTMEKIKC